CAREPLPSIRITLCPPICSIGRSLRPERRATAHPALSVDKHGRARTGREKRAARRPYPGFMARKKDSTPKAPKEPGRIKQMYDVFKMTRKYDPASQWWMLLGFAGPIALATVGAILISGGNIFG